MRDSRNEIYSLEGVFHDSEDGIAVQTESHSVSIESLFLKLQGSVVHLSLHHLPPTPRVLDVPGAGACMWGGFCPCGHESSPGWLYNLTASGVLVRASEGNWTLGGAQIPLNHYMMGHRGRIVIFSEGPKTPSGVDSLLEDVEGLLVSLKGLRTAFLTEED